MQMQAVFWVSGSVKGGEGRVADGTLVGERHQDIHVVDGEKARLAVDHALVPVVVDLVGQSDDVALLEAQLTFILWLEVVECSTTWLVHGGCEGDKQRWLQLCLNKHKAFYFTCLDV